MPLIYGPASNIIMLYPNRTSVARTRADISAIFETEKSLGYCRYPRIELGHISAVVASIPFHSISFHSILIKI